MSTQQQTDIVTAPTHSAHLGEMRRTLQLSPDASPILIKFEEGVREFTKQFNELTADQFRSHLQTALKDVEFPVVAEFRLDFGSNIRKNKLSPALQEIAGGLGHSSGWHQYLLSCFRSSTESDLECIAGSSPAVLELSSVANTYNLELRMYTGIESLGAGPHVGKQVVRLMLILNGGSSQVSETLKKTSACELKDHHPTMFGKYRIQD